jgi:hypothetical protein
MKWLVALKRWDRSVKLTIPFLIRSVRRFDGTTVVGQRLVQNKVRAWGTFEQVSKDAEMAQWDYNPRMASAAHGSEQARQAQDVRLVVDTIPHARVVSSFGRLR